MLATLAIHLHLPACSLARSLKEKRGRLKVSSFCTLVLDADYTDEDRFARIFLCEYVASVYRYHGDSSLRSLSFVHRFPKLTA